MKIRLFFMALVYSLSLVPADKAFAAEACPKPAYGCESGCPVGLICTSHGRSGFLCDPDDANECGNTPPSGEQCPQNIAGCGGGCPPGLICTSHGRSGFLCDADPSNQCYPDVPPGGNCTGTGCGVSVGGASSCGAELRCESGICVSDPSCILVVDDPGPCTLSGCGDPKCGAGFSCDEGECVLNTTCVGNVIQVPYDGPKIDSLAKLIGLIYNILFPAALLVGVIMIIKGGYELMTSEGNPQLARAGQEDLTSAVMGTVFIIMSGLILKMVIVQILGGTVGF